MSCGLGLGRRLGEVLTEAFVGGRRVDFRHGRAGCERGRRGWTHDLGMGWLSRSLFLRSSLGSCLTVGSLALVDLPDPEAHSGRDGKSASTDEGMRRGGSAGTTVS